MLRNYEYLNFCNRSEKDEVKRRKVGVVLLPIPLSLCGGSTKLSYSVSIDMAHITHLITPYCMYGLIA